MVCAGAAMILALVFIKHEIETSLRVNSGSDPGEQITLGCECGDPERHRQRKRDTNA